MRTSCRMQVSMRWETCWKAPMLSGSSCTHISCALGYRRSSRSIRSKGKGASCDGAQRADEAYLEVQGCKVHSHPCYRCMMAMSFCRPLSMCVSTELYFEAAKAQFQPSHTCSRRTMAMSFCSPFSARFLFRS